MHAVCGVCEVAISTTNSSNSKPSLLSPRQGVQALVTVPFEPPGDGEAGEYGVDDTTPFPALNIWQAV